ncbi:MAG: hypothetical protein JWO95_2210 [Verrucomicrobiales bacterium]|nr:hypothetical protein [Verrucomicrobiales bacterium]
MPTLYQRDLAWIHHHAYGRFAQAAGPQLLKMLSKAGIRNGVLIDLACGSGIWADTAHRAGFDVLAVDRSKAMLDIAKVNAPKVQFRCASLHGFKLPQCDVVTIIGEGIQYLQPTESKRPALRPLFARIAKALRPGGFFIFDAIAQSKMPLNYHHGRAGRDWAVCVEAKQERNLLVRNIVSFRKVGGAWRRAEETHRAVLIDVNATREALRHCGFSVTTHRSYGQYALGPNRFAFIARKKR